MNNLLSYQVESVESETTSTAYAGVALLVEAFLRLVSRQQLAELAQATQIRNTKTLVRHLVSLISLMASGGEHISDIEVLRADGGLGRLIGMQLSSATQLKDFLYRFSQRPDGMVLTAEQDQALSQQGHAQIRPEGPALQSLDRISEAVWKAVVADTKESILTVEIDATIIEAASKAALWSYKKVKGFQPQMAFLAEHELWIADEFRDGNVPASFAMEPFVVRVLDRLEKTHKKLVLRADSACYVDGVLVLLEKRGVDFAISATMSESLKKSIAAVSESDWHDMPKAAHRPKTSKKAKGRRLRPVRQSADDKVMLPEKLYQWAEVDFVPDAGRNRKKQGQPLRYLAIRVVEERPKDDKQQDQAQQASQLDLFDESEDSFADKTYRYFAVVTNMDGDGHRIIRWHRAKQGSIEHGHDIAKNQLGAGVMPTSRFGANAAWLRIVLMVHNLIQLTKKQLPADCGLQRAKPKRLRFVLLNVAARVVFHARRLVLKLDSTLLLAKYLRIIRARLKKLTVVGSLLARPPNAVGA